MWRRQGRRNSSVQRNDSEYLTTLRSKTDRSCLDLFRDINDARLRSDIISQMEDPTIGVRGQVFYGTWLLRGPFSTGFDIRQNP